MRKCAKCGFENCDENRLCGECGSRLSAPDPAEDFLESAKGAKTPDAGTADDFIEAISSRPRNSFSVPGGALLLIAGALMLVTGAYTLIWRDWIVYGWGGILDEGTVILSGLVYLLFGALTALVGREALRRRHWALALVIPTIDIAFGGTVTILAAVGLIFIALARNDFVD